MRVKGGFGWVLRFCSDRCEVSDVTMCWEMIGLCGGCGAVFDRVVCQ